MPESPPSRTDRAQFCAVWTFLNTSASFAFLSALPEDEYGQLGQTRLDESEDWMPWAISQNEFEDAWEAAQ